MIDYRKYSRMAHLSATELINHVLYPLANLQDLKTRRYRTAALAGELGSSADALIYAGAIARWHLRKYDQINDAANRIREVLTNGEALNHFNAAKN